MAGETWERAVAAYDWLARAQDAMTDGGVAYGYFPCDVAGGWKRSYPETTGYIITSLLEFARRTGRSEARERALRMARWEAAVQMPSGAVQGGIIAPPDKQTPAAFNTGMVLDGWTSALALERDPDDPLGGAPRGGFPGQRPDQGRVFPHQRPVRRRRDDQDLQRPLRLGALPPRRPDRC